MCVCADRDRDADVPLAMATRWCSELLARMSASMRVNPGGEPSCGRFPFPLREVCTEEVGEGGGGVFERPSPSGYEGVVSGE